MKAIIGCALLSKGEWWVQLRTPAERLFDQVIVSTAIGSTREEAVERAMNNGGVTEIVDEFAVAQRRPAGTTARSSTPLIALLRRVCEALDGSVTPL